MQGYILADRLFGTPENSVFDNRSPNYSEE